MYIVERVATKVKPDDDTESDMFIDSRDQSLLDGSIQQDIANILKSLEDSDLPAPNESPKEEVDKKIKADSNLESKRLEKSNGIKNLKLFEEIEVHAGCEYGRACSVKSLKIKSIDKLFGSIRVTDLDKKGQKRQSSEPTASNRKKRKAEHPKAPDSSSIHLKKTDKSLKPNSTKISPNKAETAAAKNSKSLRKSQQSTTMRISKSAIVKSEVASKISTEIFLLEPRLCSSRGSPLPKGYRIISQLLSKPLKSILVKPDLKKKALKKVHFNNSYYIKHFTPDPEDEP